MTEIRLDVRVRNTDDGFVVYTRTNPYPEGHPFHTGWDHFGTYNTVEEAETEVGREVAYQWQKATTPEESNDEPDTLVTVYAKVAVKVPAGSEERARKIIAANIEYGSFRDGLDEAFGASNVPMAIDSLHVPAPTDARVFRVLDASSSHVPDNVFEDLSGQPGVSADRTGYGWLVTVPEDIDRTVEQPEDEFDEGTPTSVIALWTFAKAHDCSYILLDQDADELPGLSTFDW